MNNNTRRPLARLLAEFENAPENTVGRDRLDGVPRPRRAVTAAHGAAPGDHEGSATQAHLMSASLDERMAVRGTFGNRVRTEYRDGAHDAAKAQHDKLFSDVVKREVRHGDTHVAFYHAQPPEMRLAQDLYKRVYEAHYGVRVSEHFHFLRFPGPDGSEFTRHANATEFVEAAMHEHGFIDDHTPAIASDVVSANLALHGNIGHPGEETFERFQRGTSPSKPDVAKLISGYLEKFGHDTSTVETFVKRAGEVNATKEGSVIQILVPKERVDELAYVSHMYGLPHDDAVLRDMHGYSPIEYGRAGAFERESLEEELVRNLGKARERWDTIRDTPREELGKEPDLLVKDLHERTLAKLQAGDFRPSRVLEAYMNDPDALRHERADQHAERMNRHPEHFGGQGVDSADEVRHMQNRANATQARLLMSARPGGTLDPNSDIIIVRHTTQTQEQERKYEGLLEKYVGFLEKAKRLKQVERAVNDHNAQGGRLRSPENVHDWDEKSHQGTVVKVDEQKFAMHTGRGEYTMLPPQRGAQEMQRHVGRQVSVNQAGQVQPLQQGRSLAR